MSKNKNFFIDKQKLSSQEQMEESQYHEAHKKASQATPKIKKKSIAHKRGSSLAKQTRKEPRNYITNPNPDQKTLDELAKIRKISNKKEEK